MTFQVKTQHEVDMAKDTSDNQEVVPVILLPADAASQSAANVTGEAEKCGKTIIDVRGFPPL